MQPRMEIRNIVKSFGKTIALNRVSLSPSRGLNIILGPNGAGKSTLLRCIDGLYRPDSGSITINGTNPYMNDEIRNDMSLLTDNYALYDFLTVLDNMKFFGRLYDMSDAETISRTKSILKELGASEYINTKVSALSRGTKQKAAFCRAVLKEPSILLLDEPTAFLDANAAESVREILRGYIKEGKMVLFVTQKIDEVTRINGKISVIKAGRIIRDTTTEDLFNTLLRNSLIHVRLANQIDASRLSDIPGFIKPSTKTASFLKFRIRNFKDINMITQALIKKNGYIINIDYVEPFIENLTVIE